MHVGRQCKGSLAHISKCGAGLIFHYNIKDILILEAMLIFHANMKAQPLIRSLHTYIIHLSHLKQWVFFAPPWTLYISLPVFATFHGSSSFPLAPMKFYILQPLLNVPHVISRLPPLFLGFAPSNVPVFSCSVWAPLMQSTGTPGMERQE